MSRSVTSAPPSGRNATPHGTRRPLASTVAATLALASVDRRPADGVGRFGGPPAASGRARRRCSPAGGRAAAPQRQAARRHARPLTGARRRVSVHDRASVAAGRRGRGHDRSAPAAGDGRPGSAIASVAREGLDRRTSRAASCSASCRPGVDVEVCAGRRPTAAVDPAEVEFWVPPFLSSGDVGRRWPTGARACGSCSCSPPAPTPGSAGCPPGVTLCDARGVHDSSTAEWVVTAILAYAAAFPTTSPGRRRAGEWAYAEVTPTDELAGKRVLIVGAGSIGAAVAARLAPFEVDAHPWWPARARRRACTASTSCRGCCRRPTSWCCWCR